MPEQGEGRLPDGPPFSYEVGQRALSGPHLRRIGLIVEARQRGRIAAADAERPVGEDPLAIGQVAQHLLDAPLIRRVAVVAAGLGHTLEPLADLRDLISQDRHHVFVIGDAGDVAGQGRGVLVALGAGWCDHEAAHGRGIAASSYGAPIQPQCSCSTVVSPPASRTFTVHAQRRTRRFRLRRQGLPRTGHPRGRGSAPGRHRAAPRHARPGLCGRRLRHERGRAAHPARRSGRHRDPQHVASSDRAAMPAGRAPRRHRQAIRPHARGGPRSRRAGRSAAAGALGEDAFVVTLHDPALRAVWRGSMLPAAPGPSFAVHGTAGSFIKYGVDAQEAALKAGRTPGEPDWDADPPALYGTLTTPEGVRPVPTIPSSYARYYENVRDAILGKAPIAVTSAQALDVMRGLELAVASSQQRCVLPWTT